MPLTITCRLVLSIYPANFARSMRRTGNAWVPGQHGQLRAGWACMGVWTYINLTGCLRR